MKSLSRSQIVAVGIAVIVVGYFLGQHLFFTSNSNETFDSDTGGQTNESQTMSVTYEDTVVGTGAEATTGKTLTVHYVGTLADGTVFDSSRARNEPFQFTVGEGRVIQGWEQGLIGMKVGGKRRLVIPPELGYGANGSQGIIPPNATLTFEIELLNVE